MPKYIIDTNTLTISPVAADAPPAPQPAQPAPAPSQPAPVADDGYWETVTLPWASTGPTDRPRTVNFGKGGGVVVTFTVPADAAGKTYRVVGVECEGGWVPRTAALSEVPRDFSCALARSDGGDVTFYCVVGEQKPGWTTIHPGRTYYLNVVNQNASGEWTVGDGQTSNMWWETTLR